MDYTDYGYNRLLTKSNEEGQQPTMFAADSKLLIGGLGAGQISEGALQQDINLEGGRIIINDPESGTTITIGKLD
jgi:hypothetical protein